MTRKGLEPGQVLRIKRMLRSNFPKREIARLAGVSRTTVDKIASQTAVAGKIAQEGADAECDR
jgi:DNA invertase Pin-like site-specific DNA recombinase